MRATRERRLRGRARAPREVELDPRVPLDDEAGPRLRVAHYAQILAYFGMKPPVPEPPPVDMRRRNTRGSSRGDERRRHDAGVVAFVCRTCNCVCVSASLSKWNAAVAPPLPCASGDIVVEPVDARQLRARSSKNRRLPDLGPSANPRRASSRPPWPPRRSLCPRHYARAAEIKCSSRWPRNGARWRVGSRG